MSTASEPGRDIRVEVAYATPARQTLLTVQLPPGSTVAEAIEASGIRDRCPDIPVDPAEVGIFSRKRPLDHILQDGDRVEIYRPLRADPKEVRRQRAAETAEKRSS